MEGAEPRVRRERHHRGQGRWTCADWDRQPEIGTRAAVDGESGAGRGSGPPGIGGEVESRGRESWAGVRVRRESCEVVAPRVLMIVVDWPVAEGAGEGMQEGYCCRCQSTSWVSDKGQGYEDSLIDVKRAFGRGAWARG